MTTAWRIFDGTADNELRGPWIDILTTQSWETLPRVRGTDLRLPGVDGAVYRPEKPRDVKDFEIPLVVFPVDRTTGLVTTTAYQHMQENLDFLFGKAAPVGSQATVRKQVDALPVREILAELVDGVDVGPYRENPTTRALVLRWSAAIPYWRELPILASGSPPTYNPGGNAPVTDAVITFTGGTDPRLTNNTTGDWIELSGTLASPVVVDVGARTVTQGGSPVLDLFSRNLRRWMTFRPAANSLTLTGGGSVSIAGYRKWYN